MQKNLWMIGFVISALFALWPAYPAWVQLSPGVAATLSGVALVSLLLHLVIANPTRHPLIWVAPFLGWALAVNAIGDTADRAEWASSFIVMCMAGFIARICLATYSRHREGVA